MTSNPTPLTMLRWAAGEGFAEVHVSVDDLRSGDVLTDGSVVHAVRSGRFGLSHLLVAERDGTFGQRDLDHDRLVRVRRTRRSA